MRNVRNEELLVESSSDYSEKVIKEAENVGQNTMKTRTSVPMQIRIAS